LLENLKKHPTVGRPTPSPFPKSRIKPTTPTAPGLEELFVHCLRKVSPAHPLSAGVWYIDSARIWLVIHVKKGDFL
jgi:hypothetical protein